MIYLDHGATSWPKPASVRSAMDWALEHCGNPGRGGHDAAMAAAKVVFDCRCRAAEFFGCQPEQVVFTANCTQGLNVALHSLVRPGSKVVISGFEHNAVTRTLHGLRADILVAGRKLFDWEDTVKEFEKALKNGAEIAAFTHVSNVFGYILPVEEMASICRKFGVPFVIDAAQSAGILPIDMESLGADFIAMPGHKGLLGPQGTGLLLCKGQSLPLLFGGTGSDSLYQQMPNFLPDRLEPGTLNVPGIAGLCAGMEWVQKMGLDRIFRRERKAAESCGKMLQNMGFPVFAGPHQAGTVSFVAEDSEDVGQYLADWGIAVRSGFHCAPLAHESAGTLARGTVRISFGHDASSGQVQALKRALRHYLGQTGAENSVSHRDV